MWSTGTNSGVVNQSIVDCVFFMNSYSCGKLKVVGSRSHDLPGYYLFMWFAFTKALNNKSPMWSNDNFPKFCTKYNGYLQKLCFRNLFRIYLVMFKDMKSNRNKMFESWPAWKQFKAPVAFSLLDFLIWVPCTSIACREYHMICYFDFWSPTRSSCFWIKTVNFPSHFVNTQHSVSIVIYFVCLFIVLCMHGMPWHCITRLKLP